MCGTSLKQHCLCLGEGEQLEDIMRSTPCCYWHMCVMPRPTCLCRAGERCSYDTAGATVTAAFKACRHAPHARCVAVVSQPGKPGASSGYTRMCWSAGRSRARCGASLRPHRDPTGPLNAGRGCLFCARVCVTPKLVWFEAGNPNS